MIPTKIFLPDYIEKKEVDRIANTTKNTRPYVLKQSGFSEQAFGGRGVTIGLEESTTRWKERVQSAYSGKRGLWIIQDYIESWQPEVEYWDKNTDSMVRQRMRLRVLPFFFKIAEEAEIGAVEVNARRRRKVHLMNDATSVPAALTSVIHK